MQLQNTKNDMVVVVYWIWLSGSEDSPKPIAKVYEDVPQLGQKLFMRKTTSQVLVKKALYVLCIW